MGKLSGGDIFDRRREMRHAHTAAEALGTFCEGILIPPSGLLGTENHGVVLVRLGNTHKQGREAGAVILAAAYLLVPRRPSADPA